MENRIECFIQFDYKGETLRPTVQINLDEMMRQQGKIPNLYPLLARENGIGLYSYELEVMESLPIEVGKVEGALVSRFVDGQTLDQSGFEEAWHLQSVRSEVEQIAQQHLDQSVLEQHPTIIEAMLQAYQLGKRKP